MSNIDNTESSLTSTVIQTTKTHVHQCKICGAPASCAHFGAISCQACKVFFQRSAPQGQDAFTCDQNEQCDININNRHICKYCRLKKCFQFGMTTDKFRASRSTKPKTKSLGLVQRQSHQPQQLSTINLLRSDNSLLTMDDWTYLSNLCHIYEDSQLGSISQRLIDTHDNSASININYEKLIEKLSICGYETTGNYLRLNADLCKLSSDDRSIVLRTAADNITCMAVAFTIDHYHLFSLVNFYNFMAIKCGKSIVDLQQWVAKYMDPDVILFKLTLSLFALSQTTYLYHPNHLIHLTNCIRTYHVQSQYATIMWKYLIYKYGYNEAVKRFTNIVSLLSAFTILIYHVQTLTTHVHNIESLAEETELKIVLDDLEDIVSSNS